MRAATPAHLQYVIDDSSTRSRLYDNRAISAKVRRALRMSPTRVRSTTGEEAQGRASARKSTTADLPN